MRSSLTMGEENIVNIKQPKPESRKYEDLINDIERGRVQIPAFQREFVWHIDRTAKLLDSILKGYPIGTFILWRTDSRLNHHKEIGDYKLEPAPEGGQIEYVLDGQQRIASLFASYKGVKIRKEGERKRTDFKQIYVILDDDIEEDDGQLVTAKPPENSATMSLHEVLNLTFSKGKSLESSGKYSAEEVEKIEQYQKKFVGYEFSVVLLKRDERDVAIEVFTRINTGGQTLTLFEIMSAMTYDETQNFDMQKKWKEWADEVENYQSISKSVILSLLSLYLSKSKECKRKTILSLGREDIIENWDDAISNLKEAIEYFKTVYEIPVSQLLPYDSLLVPFAYFFWKKNTQQPDERQRKLLQEFFWRMSLSYRYSSSTESRLAQDIRRINLILENEQPDYRDISIKLNTIGSLIDTTSSAGNSFCKAIMCVLASRLPKNFDDSRRVNLDNSFLKQAHGKNYHHFFPRAYLIKNGVGETKANSLVNITLVSDRLNKRLIGAKPPSRYIGDFETENSQIEDALNSHLISLDGFGIREDDYDTFLQARAERILTELEARLNVN